MIIDRETIFFSELQLQSLSWLYTGGSQRLIVGERTTNQTKTDFVLMFSIILYLKVVHESRYRLKDISTNAFVIKNVTMGREGVKIV